MFERTISLVGKDNFDKIQDVTVLIVGLGGVGGYACESLVRSGIKNIILIDHDKIDISNINRQIIATSKNVGNDKVLEFESKNVISEEKGIMAGVPISAFLANYYLKNLDFYFSDTEKKSFYTL